ncbi:hemerythrin domain-containing protein [Thiocapsa sp.]|uniref:hemerythrin domain-containing protein n=1 Tax=Thiocapsa sp. TaxID=2024551 RepID=UPI0025E671E5|nr:hemerythrin domain-containing protein [Thiocapsa sp.]
MNKEKVKGHIEETKGKVKEVAGKVADNKAMDKEGTTQKHAGKNKADAGDKKKSAKSTSTPKAQEATALLRRDHKVVSDLFDKYEKTNVKSKKKSLVSQICADLTIHAQIEEEIFYPAVKAALKDKELVPEAIVEHATLKDLIAEVEGVEPDGETFDAKIKVLSEYVKNHVKEEQNEMFPRATASKLDMMELGAQIASRKEELVAERSRRA